MNGFIKYLQRTEQSYSDFGRKINKPTETVRRWAKGMAVPSPRNMPLVIQAAENQLSANDFYTQ